ncbi:hypothetical protein RF11_10386 [Thelohanellus kitauei]|uniref:Uncharacterized protein n=1 Tax=Thelohanellus kitauei TaxID=669202 RepID=A0A0C2J4B3_THEKT|nr:hypothetical protein RF11_10386 [Thelohanellus kitauei]
MEFDLDGAIFVFKILLVVVFVCLWMIFAYCLAHNKCSRLQTIINRHFRRFREPGSRNSQNSDASSLCSYESYLISLGSVQSLEPPDYDEIYSVPVNKSIVTGEPPVFESHISDTV